MNTFYVNDLKSGLKSLGEEEAKHCALVLRMQVGDDIRLVDGKGGTFLARLTRVNKKQCEFELMEEIQQPKKPFHIHLAIAPTKNMDRMEWMVEKLGELGVDELSFLKCEHSERTKFRLDRLEKKAISAMKQSGNAWLMKINDLTTLPIFLKNTRLDASYMAHVHHGHPYLTAIAKPNQSTVLLIGPEGDFSLGEVAEAEKYGYQLVSLGKSTLRTETAGMVACQMINTVNKY